MDEPTGATPLDPDERAGLKIRSIETRADLDRFEQANMTDGMRWLARQRSPDVLSEGFARDLHRRLFGDVWRWAGTFRTSEKNIGVDPREIGIELRHLLDNTRYWIDHATYPARELALRFHHRLVQTHLFPNGNGRHARLMTDALCRHVLSAAPVDWGGGAKVLQAEGAHRKAYIEALRAADGGDFAPLLALFPEQQAPEG